MADPNPYLDRIRADYQKEQPLYEAFATALKILLQQLCDSRGIEPQTIEARGKTLESVIEKLRKYPNHQSLDEIKDLCGARIILYYRSDISAARNLIDDEFEILDEESHGAEAAEAFGYQSLHLIVRLKDPRRGLVEWAKYRDLQAEIQIRTVLAHAWAAISHKLDYKSSSEIPHQSRRKLFRVAALLETGDDLFGEFRTEVDELRQSYRRGATSDSEWFNLELNLDSLMAAWGRLAIDKVVETALGAGFIPPTRPDDPQNPEARRREIGELIGFADAAGFRTVGDIATQIEKIPKQKSLLKELAEKADELGFRPFAVSADVVALSILMDNPHLLDQDKAAKLKHPIRDALRQIASD